MFIEMGKRDDCRGDGCWGMHWAVIPHPSPFVFNIFIAVLSLPCYNVLRKHLTFSFHTSCNKMIYSAKSYSISKSMVHTFGFRFRSCLLAWYSRRGTASRGANRALSVSAQPQWHSPDAPTLCVSCIHVCLNANAYSQCVNVRLYAAVGVVCVCVWPHSELDPVVNLCPFSFREHHRQPFSGIS